MSAKNIQLLNAKKIKDPATREVMIYVVSELDRIKALPPVNQDPKNLATIVNKITRNL